MKPNRILRMVIEDVLVAAILAGATLAWLVGPETILRVFQ